MRTEVQVLTAGRFGPSVPASASARALLGEVRGGHPHRLVRGASGTGKSALLAAVREVAAGPTTGLPDAAPAPGAVVLVDDAHLLAPQHLALLADIAARPDVTLVVATEPRPANDSLRALSTALGGTVALGHLSPREIAQRAELTLGVSLPTPLVALLHRVTGGLPRCVDAALDALRQGGPNRDGAERAVTAAVSQCHRETLGGLDADLLAALAVATTGTGLDPVELARTLGLDPGSARELVDRTRGCGLVLPSGALLGSAHEPLQSLLGAQRTAGLQAESLRTRTALGTLDLAAARAFADAGVTDHDLAEFLCRQAELAPPRLAAELYGQAVRAGAAESTLALRRAEAAALGGDLDTAVRLADDGLERAAELSASELRAAVRIAASVAAHQGMLTRSADLYEWLGPARAGADSTVASMVLLATGRPDAASAMAGVALSDNGTGVPQPNPAPPSAVPPTSGAAAAALLAEGLRQSLDGPSAVALNTLTRALSLGANAARTVLLPDTGAATTALAALHCGELERARTVLTRALDGGTDDVNRTRHLLLLTWASMTRGELDTAAQQMNSMSDTEMSPRDSLFAAALRVGLARRTGDVGALRQSWDRAQGVVAEHCVDLFSLLPLGELWLAAARLAELHRVTHLVDQARDLLTALGEPALWGSPLHWYGVQAAILTETPADLLPHAHALGVAAETSHYAAGLARAGRAWLRVLQGETDAGEVEHAARTLAGIGLPWDGARLAGEAALRAADTASATTLLQVARSLRPGVAAPVETATPAGGAPSVLGSGLTERESDVAQLLVTGLTYRDIGARLFISAKTVEHHVARIRRRLDAPTRAEMLSMLRAMGYGA
ncbi:LuxR C-terminal-related transcriptional regulator [Rhodococcus kronopolitis]|uniref:LuxR C-terminal-related transcriptional regulator n=1 Tax=Rhodococcus kronopolitis TaxID=1460226 RepID=A0ABV9FVF8_9NOCA